MGLQPDWTSRLKINNNAFFGDMSTWVLCLFFDWVIFLFLILSCKSCLFILDIYTLSVASFANIFSHRLSFQFCSCFLCCEKAYIPLIRSHLFIFTFKNINLFIYLAAPGLSCGMWGLVPWAGIKLWPAGLGAWSLGSMLGLHGVFHQGRKFKCKSRHVIPQLCSLFNDYVGYSESFVAPYTFYNCLFYFHEKGL